MYIICKESENFIWRSMTAGTHEKQGESGNKRHVERVEWLRAEGGSARGSFATSGRAREKEKFGAMTVEKQRGPA